MPNRKVVLLTAGKPRLCGSGSPAGILKSRSVLAVETYHPGRMAFRDPDPAVREARANHRFEAFREVRRLAALLERTIRSPKAVKALSNNLLRFSISTGWTRDDQAEDGPSRHRKCCVGY